MSILKAISLWIVDIGRSVCLTVDVFTGGSEEEREQSPTGKENPER